MREIIQIALDGPAGAGKSSVAKKLAQRLKITYIDTGAMYRAVAWLILQKGLSLQDEAAIGQLVESIDITFGPIDEAGRQTVWCNGVDCTEAIRSSEVSNFVSAVSAMAIVRKALVRKQQAVAANQSVIMDGRDIATVVLPNAPYKFFLTASLEERTRRRMAELTLKGKIVDADTLKAEIAARDQQDARREHSPLIKAEDALLIDTDNLTFEQVVDKLFKIIIK